MKRNGLVTPYLIFVRGMMFLGGHTTGGRTGMRRKEDTHPICTPCKNKKYFSMIHSINTLWQITSTQGAVFIYR